VIRGKSSARAAARVTTTTVALLLAFCGLVGCTASAGSSVTKIGLLLPDSVTPRYAAADKPYFVAKIRALDPTAQVVYANADGDAAKQQQQAESMLTQGVKVLVLDAQDGTAAQAIVTEARAKNVPVIDYDRLVAGGKSDYYISFDNERVGELQAQALISRMTQLKIPRGAGFVMLNGSPTDNNARQFKKGAHRIFDASGYKLLAEFDTPLWLPKNAQDWMDGTVTRFGSKITAVYGANDGLAGAAIASMKAGGLTNPLPPVVGQDASLAGLQNILAGDQYMTVYKAIKPEAEQAAQLAMDLVKGEHPAAPRTVNGIPSFLLVPVAVTANNIQAVIVGDRFDTAAQLCTPDYASACTKYGIK
jgi:D-xylose transport system substrate-binding protein